MDNESNARVKSALWSNLISKYHAVNRPANGEYSIYNIDIYTI